MAGTTILAGRILLLLMAGRLIRSRVKLGVVHGLLHGRSAVLVRLAPLRDGRMAITGHRLHGNRNSQRIAAEQRQPDGQNHCNKFSNGARHVRSLAKSGDPVKYKGDRNSENTINHASSIFPIPLPTSPLKGEEPCSLPFRGRAREGVETCTFHHFHSHPDLPPARGKGQFGSNELFGINLLIIRLFTLQLSRYHARNYDNVMPHP